MTLIGVMMMVTMVIMTMIRLDGDDDHGDIIIDGGDYHANIVCRYA